jgi:pimeloyl-ACP methyl ester carboxylesterase
MGSDLAERWGGEARSALGGRETHGQESCGACVARAGHTGAGHMRHRSPEVGRDVKWQRCSRKRRRLEELPAAGRRHARSGCPAPTVTHAPVYKLAFVWQMRYVGRPAGSHGPQPVGWYRPPSRGRGVGSLVVVYAMAVTTPPTRARRLAAGIAGASLVEIPDSTHCLPIQKPTEFVAAIGSFLEIPR